MDGEEFMWIELPKFSEGYITEIILRRSSFDTEEYDLYRRYQITMHNYAPDYVSESSYRRFLVDTPLVFVSSNDDDTVPRCGFGSFHQQYVIDASSSRGDRYPP